MPRGDRAVAPSDSGGLRQPHLEGEVGRFDVITTIERFLKPLSPDGETVSPTTALTGGARGGLHPLPVSHPFSAVGGRRTAGLRHILILLLIPR